MPAGRSTTSCAFRRAARWGATTASTGTGSRCRYRRSAIVITMSGPPCGCTNIPMAGLPSSTARAASRGSTRTESRSMSRALLNSARRRRPDGLVDNAARSPQPHRPSNNSSGHLMRYDTRTSSRATDSPPAAPNSLHRPYIDLSSRSVEMAELTGVWDRPIQLAC